MNRVNDCSAINLIKEKGKNKSGDIISIKKYWLL